MRILCCERLEMNVEDFLKTASPRDGRLHLVVRTMWQQYIHNRLGLHPQEDSGVSPVII